MHASKIAPSTVARRFYCGDVDLFHLHHRIERALGGRGIGIGYRSRQSQRRNLPRQAPFVLAPAAGILFTAVADDSVPVTIRFGLVIGCDLKRECPVVLDLWSAIEPEAGNSHHGKLDRQHIPFLTGRKVSRREVHRANRRIGKGCGIKSRRVLGVAIVPKANRILCLLLDLSHLDLLFSFLGQRFEGLLWSKAETAAPVCYVFQYASSSETT